MGQHTLEIKQEQLFPLHFRFFGILLTISGLVLITRGLGVLITLGACALILLGLIIITTRYGLKIHIQEPSYQVYTLLLGVKRGKKHFFGAIKKIYINEVHQSTMMSSWSGQNINIDKRLFKAFMRLDNGEKIHLDSDKSLEKLEARVMEYEKLLYKLLKEH